MTTWIGSDYHLNHLNILKYCSHRVPSSYDGYAPHDWDDVAEMNEMIIEKHNSVVAPDDEIYLIGDICMGQIIKAPSLIRRLNGRKYLVKGNHDKSLHKLILSDPELSDLFVWIKDYHEMSYTYNGKKHMLCMLHFPMKYWNGSGHSSIHFHGHLHGSPSGIDGKILDVGIDTNGLMPYKMDEAIELVLDKLDSPHHND